MSELSLMLLPLDTLAGWPTVTNPTPLQTLGLLFGCPIAVMIVISLLAYAPRLSKANRGSDAKYTEPVWVGGSSQAVAGAERSRPALESAASSTALGSAAGSAPPGAQTAAAAEPPAELGGASARW